MKLSEIARRIGGEIKGGSESASSAGALGQLRDIEINNISDIESAGPGDITFISNPKYAGALKKTRASAVIAGEGMKSSIPAVVCKNPYLGFAKTVALLREPPPRPPEGISPLADVSGAGVDASACIAAFVFAGKGSGIGAGTAVMPHVFIGEGAQIGKNCFIYPNVTIREKVIIGDNVIIHSGSVIGSDGYGYVQDEGGHKKIPQAGNVVIENDVEIGANVCVDRAALSSTVIGEGTKIDNLVHIAHNVRIGRHCLILGQTGIAGSTVIGDYTTLASQSGVSGHLKIGNRVTVAARGGVIKDLSDGVLVSGFPARDHREMLKVYAATMRLPEMLEMFRKMKGPQIRRGGKANG
ncbi:MAG: UDP-3-O-(3-hydroxymyristoyl)glucosamine N-acyltransferase [Elusimicrobiota bacterium]|nr:UDP-3-O-(3-hydroxymyristoyl)glucosamine N-acyltransferase [Elusimicrobiota bacterium]